MKKSWHEDAFFGLHFDIHANPADKNLGRDADRNELIRQLSKVAPDYVQCDCKGHPGYTAFPTEVGTAAPGIAKDALKEWRAATKEMGVPLIMHYSGVWDTAALLKHPEWSRQGDEPVTSQANNGNSKDINMTCPLSGYTDEYMIPQMEEIIERYDVDGFWVDGENWASYPCYCERCTSAFVKKYGVTKIPHSKEDENWDLWLAFSRDNFVDHVRRYTNAIHAKKESCTSCSNWMYTVRQPDEITVDIDYISGDFSWTWSCTSALIEARFMDSRAIKWDLMAWAFTSYGPMENWVFKTVPALCQEAGVVMASGGAFTIYDTPNRWGSLVDWHMDELAEVGRFCRARQRFCQDTTSVGQAVILHSKEHYYAENQPLFNCDKATQPIEGALHVLLENNISTDLMTGAKLMTQLERYPLCVVAEQNLLDEAWIAQLKDYVQKGGALIVSGAKQCKAFADLLGVDVDEARPQSYNDVDGLNIQIGKRTVPLIGNWGSVVEKSANRSWKILSSRDGGAFAHDSGVCAATVKRCGAGVIAGIYGDLFQSYAFSHYPDIRRFVGEIVGAMQIKALVKVDAPACIAVSVREKGENLYVNLVNLGCDQPTSPTHISVENVPPTGPISMQIPLDDCPKSVSLEPGGMPVHWEYEQGILAVKIDQVGIHEIVAVGR